MTKLNEDMGGVSAPLSTLGNTPGMGNVVPASIAGVTGSQQTSPASIGSGDKFGGSLGTYTQSGKIKKRKKRRVKENSINPYDKIGTLIAKELNVPMHFKAKNKRKNTMKQTVGTKLVNESLDEFIGDNSLNEEKWIPRDMKKGALHKMLNIPEDKEIPMSLIDKKIKMLQKRGEGDKKLSAHDAKFLRRLIAAKNMKNINK